MSRTRTPRSGPQRPGRCRSSSLRRVAIAVWLGSLGSYSVAAAQADASDQPVRATPEQLARLRDILARPEFRAAEGQGEFVTFVDPIRTALAAMILTALRWLFSLFSVGGAPGYGLLALAVLIAIIAAVVFARLVRGTVAA